VSIKGGELVVAADTSAKEEKISKDELLRVRGRKPVREKERS